MSLFIVTTMITYALCLLCLPKVPSSYRRNFVQPKARLKTDDERQEILEIDQEKQHANQE